MITKILLPIDGSKTSLKSAEYAAWFAGMLNAMKGTPSLSRRAADQDAKKENDAPTVVVLLHVINEKIFSSISTPVEGGMVAHSLEPIELFLKEQGDKYMEQIETMMEEKGIRVIKSVRRGDPADEIIQEAENSEADLIIIGSHGRTSSRAAFLGSVAYSVIHNASKIPVLVVRKD